MPARALAVAAALAVLAAAPFAGADRAPRASALKSYAHVPRGQELPRKRATGPITALERGAASDGRTRWSLTVGDPAGARTIAIELPSAAPFPAAVGDTVTLDAGWSGGGPNVIGHLTLVDDAGGLRLAINQLPDGWEVDHGKRRSTERANGYDEVTYGVVLTAPGEPKKVRFDRWKLVTILGARFYASGTAVSRTLHKGKPAMPDYVGGWIDFSLIRAP